MRREGPSDLISCLGSRHFLTIACRVEGYQQKRARAISTSSRGSSFLRLSKLNLAREEGVWDAQGGGGCTSGAVSSDQGRSRAVLADAALPASSLGMRGTVAGLNNTSIIELHASRRSSELQLLNWHLG
jgi:hypothetical protein